MKMYWYINDAKVTCSGVSGSAAASCLIHSHIKRYMRILCRVHQPNHTPVAKQQERYRERVFVVIRSHSLSRVLLSEQPVSDALLLSHSRAANHCRACWEFCSVYVCVSGTAMAVSSRYSVTHVMCVNV